MLKYTLILMLLFGVGGDPTSGAVQISQRGPNLFVFRYFVPEPDRYYAQFTATAIDSNGNPIPTISKVYYLQHGSEFDFVGRSTGKLNVRVDKVSGAYGGWGRSWVLHLQPYDLVAPGYQIEHFFHEEGTDIVWAIGTLKGDSSKLYILKSNDYFSSNVIIVNSLTFNNQTPYPSIYVDKYKNIIIGWRPGPLISRDGGVTFVPIGFQWNDPENGMLCPFWNITEDDNGLMVISEYGVSLATTHPEGSHRGTFWSRDPARMTWQKRLVDRGFDSSDPNKFSGYYRHIHGYHINPVFPNVHHMFLGDAALGQPSDGTPGYYISQDGGRTWSTEIIREWAHSRGDYTTFYNGPCFITWFDSGKAFITSDTAATWHAYWWGSGNGEEWGGPSFEPVIELRANVDEESAWPDTPWMAVDVSGTLEIYADTIGNKTILWRYDADTGNKTVLAEYGDQFKWISASRHNRIPSNAPYFFTYGNRRFPR